jgi:hypothetical protein
MLAAICSAPWALVAALCGTLGVADPFFMAESL